MLGAFKATPAYVEKLRVGIRVGADEESSDDDVPLSIKAVAVAAPSVAVVAPSVAVVAPPPQVAVAAPSVVCGTASATEAPNSSVSRGALASASQPPPLKRPSTTLPPAVGELLFSKAAYSGILPGSKEARKGLLEVRRLSQGVAVTWTLGSKQQYITTDHIAEVQNTKRERAQAKVRLVLKADAKAQVFDFHVHPTSFEVRTAPRPPPCHRLTPSVAARSLCPPECLNDSGQLRGIAAL